MFFAWCLAVLLLIFLPPYAERILKRKSVIVGLIVILAIITAEIAPSFLNSVNSFLMYFTYIVWPVSVSIYVSAK